MASISSQISLVDRMSSPLMNITSALDSMISTLQSVDSNINSSFGYMITSDYSCCGSIFIVTNSKIFSI